MTEIHRLIALPVGTTKLQVRADTNFQTKNTAAANKDVFEVRLLNTAQVQIGTPLVSLSNTTAQTGTAKAWTTDGINATRDVTAQAGKDIYLSFRASVDTAARSDFFFDNVRVTATVCK